jgi:tRNA (guanine-N7-)-methyltransferase
MKPKDLKIPCKWENRHPVLLDKFLFIPSHYDRHSEYDISSFEKIFDNNNPINIEYCSGNGQWIVDHAKNNLNTNWVAVEKKFDRARKIWVKLHNMQIKNLLVVYGDGLTFSKYYLKDSSVSTFFIHFPDPWPKLKHKKNRIISDEFVNQLSRILVLNGEGVIVSDDFPTIENTIDHMLKNLSFKSFFEHPYYQEKIEKYGNSFFEDLWREKNRSIYYLKFLKCLKK